MEYVLIKTGVFGETIGRLSLNNKYLQTYEKITAKIRFFFFKKIN